MSFLNIELMPFRILIPNHSFITYIIITPPGNCCFIPPTVVEETQCFICLAQLSTGFLVGFGLAVGVGVGRSGPCIKFIANGSSLSA